MNESIRRVYQSVFINNEWVQPPGGETIEVVNPATEKVIGSAPMAGVPECQAAIAAAREAFDSGVWRNMACVQRADILAAFLDRIEANAQDVIDLIVAETGHTYGIAAQVDFTGALDITRYQLELSRRDLAETTAVTTAPNPLDGGATKLASSSSIVRKPLGVVAAITPFNAPFMLNLIKAIPAMVMGNTVVLKGSELTPLEALMLGDIALEVNLPAGVLNIITGGAAVGECLTTDPDVDVVSFTGSDKVGSTIMGQAAPTLKRLLLELGGKSASVVLADADLKTAAMFGAGAATVMAGQGCGICTRHIVHNSIFEEYVDTVRRMLWAMPVGDPANRYSQMGPLISAGQRARVERYVEQAKEEGGRIVSGGKRPIYLEKGFYYEPTLITGLSPDSAVCQEEIFGPVIAVLGFDSEEEALRIANNSTYGLSGAVFSRDRGKAYEFAQKLDTGFTYINAAALALDVQVPFGGIKRSGFGKEWGIEGLKEFSYQHTLSYPVC